MQGILARGQDGAQPEVSILLKQLALLHPDSTPL
jgi:hypothetical protein